MCVTSEKQSSKANEIVAPHKLSLFILDEIGQYTNTQLVLCARMLDGVAISSKPVVVSHDIGDDG